MLSKLLKKELALSMTPSFLIWFIMTPIFELIPTYPHYVAPIYICVAILMIFTFGMQNQDMLYTATLPVKRNDVILSRCFFIGIVEVITIILCVVSGFIGQEFLYNEESKSGININVAFAGITFILISIYNIVFVANVYKKPEKPTLLFFAAFGAFIAGYIVAETPVWAYLGFKRQTGTILTDNLPWYSLPSIGHFLYGKDLSANIAQIPLLIAGIVIWLLVWLWTYKVSCRHFKKYNF